MVFSDKIPVSIIRLIDTDIFMDHIITLAELEFGPFTTENTHLNHAGMAPWPRRTKDAIVQFAEQNASANKPDYAQWINTTKNLRETVARFINAESGDEIAFIKNTSEGLSMVGYGVDWHPGDNIVVGQQEFPSNRILWEDIAQRFGVEMRCVDLYSADTPDLALCKHIDENTRLLSVSSVQYAYGDRVNLQAIGEVCADNNILFCVDAIQSLGALPLDVQAIKADFIVADAHKWLLAPEGIGVFYCRRDCIDQLAVNQIGWASVENYGNYDEMFDSSAVGKWQLAQTARRFEPGSLNNIGIQGLNKSIELLNEIGSDNVEQCIAQRIQYLFESSE